MDTIAKSQAAVGKFFGIARSTAQLWLENAPEGCKVKGGYDLSEIAQWRIQYERTRAEQSTEDALLAGGDSPALERYRKARAELVEMDVEQRRRDLVPMSEIQDGLSRLALMLRSLGDQFKRQFGNDALELLNETLDDFDRMIDEEFGPDFDSDGEESGV